LVPPLRANAYPLSRRLAPTSHRLRIRVDMRPRVSR
jgi:hypothetical protein